MANEIRIPKGYVLARESKSERLQLLIRPTTLKKLKKEAAERGISLNELCNRLLEKGESDD